MKNARAVSAIVLGVIVTFYGTLALSRFVVIGLVGETGMESYSLTALESLIRFVFYCAVGFSVALAAGNKRIIVLAITGMMSVMVMVINTHTWLNSEMSAYGKVTAYLFVYLPTLSIVPAFVLVGFIFSKWQMLKQTET